MYKIDYQLRQTQRLTLSYFHQTGDFVLVPGGNSTSLLGWVNHDYKFYQHEANIQHVWTISSNTVNQLMLNYTRLIGGRIPSPTDSLASYGSNFAEQLPNGDICGKTPEAGCARPDFNVSGWFHATNAITGPVTGNNVYALRDVVSMTKGKHTLFIGGEANRENDAQQTTLNNYGVFAFNSSGTAPNPGANPPTAGTAPAANKTGPALLNFFYGTPATMQQDVPVYANANYFNYGVFFQDDWRVLPNLTLNLGVRYDIQTAPTNTQNMLMQFRPGVQSTIAPNNMKGIVFPGDPGVPRGGVDNRYDHFSPRIGLVWTPYPNGKTVVHLGGGIFYGSIGGNLWAYPSNGEPFSGRPTFNNVIHVSDPYATDPKDFCNADPVCIANGVGHSPYPFIYDPKNPKYVVLPAALITIDPNFRWPEVYQMNAGIQQQFSGGFAFSASFVSSLGRKLPTQWDVNYPKYNLTVAGVSGPACATTNTTQNCSYANTTSNVDNRRPYNDVSYGDAINGTAGTASNPLLKSISQIQSSESSAYNALQVSLQKQLSHGFSAQGFYVWSKDLQSLDLDTAGNTGNSAGTDPEDNNLHYLDRQRSDYDQRHTLAMSIVYKPNYGISNRPLRFAVNGWTITSIVRLQSGQPVNVTTGSDINADGINNDRPNLAPGYTRPVVTDNGRSRVAMVNNWIDSRQFCNSTGATTVWVNGVDSLARTAACPQNGAGPAGVDGTVRQNTLDAPGRRSIDASLFRDFTLYERLKFQLRGEATNVFNLTNLPAPTGSLTSGNFGRITGNISGGSFSNRVLQVGGRILF